MYLPSTAPLPQNSQNPPTQRQMESSKRRLYEVDEAIKRARQAYNCTAIAAASGWPAPPVLPPLHGPSMGSQVSEQVASVTRSEAQQARDRLIRDTSTLNDQQRQEILDAPEVIDQYSTGPCPVDPPETFCPQVVSNPAWANSTLQYPMPVCPTAAQVVKSNPWLLILLVVGGGIALNSLVSD